MKKLTIDFTRHYSTGDAREADSNTYQWDTGHVLEAIVPGAVKTAEVHYSGPASEKADPFLPDSITTDSDGNSVITSKIPNQFFEHSGRLTAYIVVTDDSANVTEYEGRIVVLNRLKPVDYVSDPTDNAADAALKPITDLVNSAKSSATAAAGSASSAKSSATAAASSASAAKASETNAAKSASAAASSAAKSADSAEAAKEYRDAAAGYVGAVSYSFMVDSEGYLCLNYKEDKT